MLPHHQAVIQEIRRIVKSALFGVVEKNPAHVGPEETLFDVVRIALRVDVTVMETMIGRSDENRVLKRSRSEHHEQELDDAIGLKGAMRKEPVIPPVIAKPVSPWKTVNRARSPQ